VPRPADPRAELEAIAREHRHVHSERARAGPEGTSRRHMGARLDELERRFSRLLRAWVDDEATRAAWWGHLRADAPPPPLPAPWSPLVFRGTAADGSRVEVRESPGGDHELVVDGTSRGRVTRVPDVLPAVGAHVGGLVCRETSRAPHLAIEALRRFRDDPGDGPPWSHARALLEDGLIDPDFGLTARGRRVLAHAAR
jgi:hypothetical protein